MNSTLDFSTYSDDQLEASLAAINREKFEQNYLACLQEIEKRKAEGRWKKPMESDQADMFKIRKWARIMALVQSIGGGLGFVSYVITYGPHIMSREYPVLNFILLLIALGMFALTAWSGWTYWKTEVDKRDILKGMLIMQIPAFSIGKLAYGFYSGFKFPIGFEGTRFAIRFAFGSDMTFRWDGGDSSFYLAVNIAAIFMLVLLRKVEAARAIEGSPQVETTS